MNAHCEALLMQQLLPVAAATKPVVCMKRQEHVQLRMHTYGIVAVRDKQVQPCQLSGGILMLCIVQAAALPVYS